VRFDTLIFETPKLLLLLLADAQILQPNSDLTLL